MITACRSSSPPPPPSPPPRASSRMTALTPSPRSCRPPTTSASTCPTPAARPTRPWARPRSGTSRPATSPARSTAAPPSCWSLVHTIVQFPPTTSVDGATAVWGPHHDALDPAEWRLTVTELADGTYDWKLEGRSRTAASARVGDADRRQRQRRRTGSFHLDFDAAERVNPRENDGKGQLDVTYDIPNRALDIGRRRRSRTAAARRPRCTTTTRTTRPPTAPAIWCSRSSATPTTRAPPPEGDHAALALARHRAPVAPTLRLRSGDLDRRGHRVRVLGHDLRAHVLRRLGRTGSPPRATSPTCAFADQDLPAR
jgi:hypothetical protein